eukprot:Pompholyxophrys_punicea_v1_NODE_61_length_4021_cov_11.209730.p2 type:complete len:114 gc:universal NODE_61_length_4021_cov_11.209730:3015-3356(+)
MGRQSLDEPGNGFFHRIISLNFKTRGTKLVANKDSSSLYSPSLGSSRFGKEELGGRAGTKSSSSLTTPSLPKPLKSNSFELGAGMSLSLGGRHSSKSRLRFLDSPLAGPERNV